MIEKWLGQPHETGHQETYGDKRLADSKAGYIRFFLETLAHGACLNAIDDVSKEFARNFTGAQGRPLWMAVQRDDAAEVLRLLRSEMLEAVHTLAESNARNDLFAPASAPAPPPATQFLPGQT